MGGGTFFKVGAHVYVKQNIGTFLWFGLAIVTSQALKYDVFSFCQHV